MPDPSTTTLETDDRFPSGPWKGYFVQRSVGESKREMEMHLSFIGGRVMGTGRDGIGPFSIVGRYDVEAGKVWWTKKYARHDVFYQGFAEGNGIWGTWQIHPIDRDGFRVWPKGIADAMEQAANASEQSTRISFDDGLTESDTLSGVSEKETVFSP